MNYYLKKESSDLIGHTNIYHIAKASWGSPVIFHSHTMPNHWPDIKSLKDIEHYVKMRGYLIYDEEGNQLPIEYFISLCENKQRSKEDLDSQEYTKDSQGYYFTDKEFS